MSPTEYSINERRLNTYIKYFTQKGGVLGRFATDCASDLHRLQKRIALPVSGVPNFQPVINAIRRGKRLFQPP